MHTYFQWYWVDFCSFFLLTLMYVNVLYIYMYMYESMYVCILCECVYVCGHMCIYVCTLMYIYIHIFLRALKGWVC